MSEWEWDPDTYLEEMAAEIPGYEELQEAVVAATADVRPTRVLELGTGTGETALRVLAEHPEASWVGIDASEPMLARAREPLEDELPVGPFDLVVSALVVHHIDGPGKRDLFARVARVLRLGGLFVLGEVVVPPPGLEGPIEIDGVMDKPDSVEDQLAWFRAAGFEAKALSVRGDLAVFHATLNSP